MKAASDPMQSSRYGPSGIAQASGLSDNIAVEQRQKQNVQSDSRDRLIEVAIEEFGTKGFEGARVDEIADRAHINKQLVYHYFEGKEGLYRAALRAAYLRFRGDEAIIRTQIAGVDAVTGLRRLVDYLFRPSDFNLYFQRLIQDENRRGASSVRQLPEVRAAYRVLVEIVEELLARGVTEGRFRPGIDPKEFYISLVGLFSIRITNAQTFSIALGIDLTSKKGRRRAFEAAMDHLIEGIKQ